MRNRQIVDRREAELAGLIAASDARAAQLIREEKAVVVADEKVREIARNRRYAEDDYLQKRMTAKM
jgi:hypothetical protein